MCEACRESVDVAASGPRQTFICLDCAREIVGALVQACRSEKEAVDA